MYITDKKIDVIIPCYQPSDKFISLLDMLAVQTCPVNRLILINTEKELLDQRITGRLGELGAVTVDGVKQDTAPETSVFRGGVILKNISRSEFDHAATRNLGVTFSDADVFMLMTDDAVPADEHLLEAMLRTLYAERAEGVTAAVYARQLAGPDSSPWERYSRAFNYGDEPLFKSVRDLPELGIKTYFMSNVCCMYRRDVFDRAGGFAEPAVFNEDMVFAASAMKQGYLIAYAPDAGVIHSHSYSAGEQFSRNFDNGMSQAMHPEVFAGLKSEGEGIRMMRTVCSGLLKNGEAARIPAFIADCGARYLGFRKGRSYAALSPEKCLKYAMNKEFVRKLYGI